MNKNYYYVIVLGVGCALIVVAAFLIPVISDLTTGTYSSVWTDILPGHTNLEAYVVLEGYDFDDDTDVPGDTEFYDMLFKDGGNTITISFNERYGTLAQQLLTQLDVNIISGTDVQLKTAN